MIEKLVEITSWYPSRMKLRSESIVILTVGAILYITVIPKLISGSILYLGAFEFVLSFINLGKYVKLQEDPFIMFDRTYFEHYFSIVDCRYGDEKKYTDDELRNIIIATYNRCDIISDEEVMLYKDWNIIYNKSRNEYVIYYLEDMYKRINKTSTYDKSLINIK